MSGGLALLEPRVDLRALVRRAFALSKPQGLGFFSHGEGDMTEVELENADGIDSLTTFIAGKCRRFRYDYVRGRSMKLNLWQDDFILAGGTRHLVVAVEVPWYDHFGLEPELLRGFQATTLVRA